MEFLMTYGWAILVVLAAIGALAYFGVLSPDRFLPDKCVFNPPLSCSEYKITAGSGTTPGSVAIGVQNNAGVALSDINLTIDSPDCVPAVLSQSYSLVENGQLVNDALLTWTCAAGTAEPGVSGDRFQANFDVVYTRSGETSTHSSTGSIQGRAE